MTAPDDEGYEAVLRRVVAGLGNRSVAASVDELPEAWARAQERGDATVHVVVPGDGVPAGGDPVRRRVRSALADRGWVMVAMTRVMWPAGAAGSARAAEAGGLSRQQRIDRDTRAVVAEVVPAGPGAVPLLADALDRTAAEVDVLLDVAGRPPGSSAEASAPGADDRAGPTTGAGQRRRRRLLGRRPR